MPDFYNIPGFCPVTPYRKTRVRLDTLNPVNVGQNFSLTKNWQEIALGEYSFDWQHAMMKNTRKVPYFGIQLTPRTRDISAEIELAQIVAETLLDVLEGGTATQAANVKGSNNWRKSDQPGANTGANPGLLGTGDRFYQKHVPAGQSLDHEDNTLPGIFIIPAPREDNVKMDPQMRDSEPKEVEHTTTWRIFHPGSDGGATSWLDTLYFGGPKFYNLSTNDGFIWGVDGDYKYAVKLRGDGIARLYALGIWYAGTKTEGPNTAQAYYDNNGEQTFDWAATRGVWIPIAEFRWCESSRVYNNAHTIHITTHTYEKPSGNYSGIIHIETQASESNNGGIFVLPSTNYPRGGVEGEFTYKVPWQIYDSVTIPTAKIPPQKVGRDERRDSRGKHQVIISRYPDFGFVVDNVVRMKWPTDGASVVTLSWSGKTPPGTVLEGFLFTQYAPIAQVGDPTSTTTGLFPPLNAFETGSKAGIGYKKYSRDSVQSSMRGSLQRDAYIKVLFMLRTNVEKNPDGTYAPNSNKRTPTLFQYSLNIDGRTVIKGDARVAEIVRNLSITQGEEDPSHESAKVTIDDLANTLQRTLGSRAGVTIIVDTEWRIPGITEVDWTDVANADKRSVLFRGYVQRAMASRRGAKIPKDPRIPITTDSNVSDYPHKEWKRYECECIGEWYRAAMGLAPIQWDFAFDPDETYANSNGTISNFTPYRVTDALGVILRWVGYASSQIEIDDSPIRFFPRYGEGGMKVTLGQQVMELGVRWAKEYLGEALVYDANASRNTDPLQWYGCWRRIPAAKPPYRNLAYFTSDFHLPDTPIGLHLVQNIHSLPTLIAGDGQIIPGAYIIKGSMQTWVTPPWANHLIVTGTGDLANIYSEFQLTAEIYNVKSYDFDPEHPTADRNSPDYVGWEIPLLRSDPNLDSPAAVRYVARRIADTTMHALKGVRFTAPLLLIQDQNDTLSVRPRPLRYYDPVIVDGVQFLVRSCNPAYIKDHIQMAVYELEAVREQFL